MNWEGRKVLVTGGASFIGSHLVDALVERGASLFVVDDLSSGRLENIQQHVDSGKVEFVKADLREPGVARDAVQGMSVVFHLVADHGGRAYVDLHDAECSTNVFLDGQVFYESLKAKVEKVVYASSGCVYPNDLQTDTGKELYLTEDLVGPPYDRHQQADNMYGWAKLIAEMALKAYASAGWTKAASCRYFTVYGPRGKEDHAVIAMTAKAFIKQNPFEVWGDGQQIRNWTYIDDIVSGTVLAAEKIDDGTAVNLGTMERIKVIDAVKEVMHYMGHEAEIKLLPDMPTGPLNRVADNSLAKKLLGWEPEYKFIDGLHKTIDWYVANRDIKDVRERVEGDLTER